MRFYCLTDTILEQTIAKAAKGRMIIRRKPHGIHGKEMKPRSSRARCYHSG